MSSAAPITPEDILFTAALLRAQALRLRTAPATEVECQQDMAAANDLERKAERMEMEAEAMQ